MDGEVCVLDVVAVVVQEFFVCISSHLEIRHFLGRCLEGFTFTIEVGFHMDADFLFGIQLIHEVLIKAYGRKELPEPTHAEDCSPEYWAGWAVAEYQWFTGRRFKDIFERIPLSKIIEMYSVYHEMDITNFIDAMEDLYKAAEGDSKLKRIRENRGLSQTELAEQSGVNLRNIQMYEQRGNDIDKAQARILYKLSRVLGCDIEDLLENPMM